MPWQQATLMSQKKEFFRLALKVDAHISRLAGLLGENMSYRLFKLESCDKVKIP
jgi:hypothetical protein